ncbi:hypothetical protein D1AOALGA4SA_684 [Olavius algarvensis Delta 1 endosymbiont]|nr:hypothetical protein D1AOALGA4SA_684 [Olavius algarvensis Delta 1 endosymbiont]
MKNTLQFVEIDLISTVGLSTTLTKSQRKNFVIITNLWKHFERYDSRFHWNRSDSIVEIYLPLKTGDNYKQDEIIS